MRFLLRPGWLAFIAAVLGFVVVCYTVLAPWQFGREAQREAEQSRIDTSNTLTPVDFGALVPDGAVPAGAEWRQVSLTGTFLRDAQTLVRLRVADGKPAYEVLTPMRLADGRVVAVDRGWVGADAQETPVVAPAPSGAVTVTGRLRLNETDPAHRAPLESDGTRQIYAVDSRSLAGVTGLQIVEGYVQLSPNQPGVLNPLEVAPAASGAPFTNRSYALQWITFGVIALVALGYFIRLEVLQRQGRREQARASKAALRDALAGRDVDAEADGNGGAGRAPGGGPDHPHGGADQGRDRRAGDRDGAAESRHTPAP